MSDWSRKAACQNHENPELWCHNPDDEFAAEGRAICFERCPVRLECGEWALREGEREIVAGGHRLWDADDVRKLQAEHPHVQARRPPTTSRTVTCVDCAATFTTAQVTQRCVPCRQGLVPAGPARERVYDLLAAGVKAHQIATLAGLKPPVISAIRSRKSPPRYVRASTADRVLAVPVPGKAVSA